MIDHVDARLKNWVAEVLGSLDVSLAPPSAATRPGVGLYLFELKHKNPLSTSKRAPLQFALRYLVTASAEKLEEAHRMLGELAFSALDNPEFEVLMDSAPPSVWAAFGVPPQPSFILEVPVRKLRVEREPGLVRQAPIIQTSPITSLCGIVLGPDDTPIAGARVEIPGLRLIAHTDYQGSFRFATVPTSPEFRQLKIYARGRALAVTADRNHADTSSPLVIRFNLLEEK